MTTPPHLVADGEELALDVAVGTARRRLSLSDRADGLLRELGYGTADVVPRVTVRALVLAGGATLPEGNDARDTAWNLGGTGGREATDRELRALADYLRAVTVEDRALDTLCEHVRGSRLSQYVEPADLTGRAERVADLNDIARGL